MMGVICDIAGNLVYVPGMFLLVIFTKFGPVAMYAILKLSDFIKFGIATVWLRQERWLVNLTTAHKGWESPVP